MTRARFLFDTLEAAASGLELVLKDARETDKTYSIAGISADHILRSGLILEGDIMEVVSKVSKVNGSAKFVN